MLNMYFTLFVEAWQEGIIRENKQQKQTLVLVLNYTSLKNGRRVLLLGICHRATGHKPP